MGFPVLDNRRAGTVRSVVQVQFEQGQDFAAVTEKKANIMIPGRASWVRNRELVLTHLRAESNVGLCRSRLPLREC